jgi:hypothetical protein
MTAHRVIAILVVALALPSINASAKPRKFDQRLAVELAAAYLRFDSRREPSSALSGIDFKHPVVTTGLDSKNREFVFVSFSSDTSGGGAYATFQVCDSNPALIPADVGTVDNIVAYRADTAKVSLSVMVALESVCPNPGT